MAFCIDGIDMPRLTFSRKRTRDLYDTAANIISSLVLECFSKLFL